MRKIATPICLLFCFAALAVVAVVDVSAQVTSDSWPIYRGDSANTGIASSTLPDKPTMLWELQAGDSLKSSPVVADGLLYVGSMDFHIYAIDINTGKEKWKFKTEAPIEAPPLVHEGVVYIGSSDGRMYALNSKTGEKTWQFETMDKILGSANIIPATKTREPRLVFGSYDYFVYCLDLKTGEKIWTYETDNYVNGCPAYINEQIIFGGCDGLLHILSPNNGKRIAIVEIDAFVAGSCAVVGDMAYVGHYENQFIAVDLTAQVIDWTYESRKFPYFASPAVTDKVVVFGGRDGRAHCATRADGKPIWEFRSRGKIDSSPVIVGDRVVVCSMGGRVHLVSLDKGEETWRYDLGKSISASPAVAAGKLFIACEDGKIYAFGSQ